MIKTDVCILGAGPAGAAAALKLDPDYEAALMNKVAILLMQKKNSEAIFILKRVLKINPTNEKANFAINHYSFCCICICTNIFAKL